MSRPLRILLLHDYGTDTGGAERQVLMLRDGLRARGHRVELLTSRASLVGGSVVADRTCAGTTHEKATVACRTANPSALVAVRRALGELRPDVVHARMLLTQLSPLVLSPLAGVPTVHQVAYYKAVCPRGTKVLPDGVRCTFPAGRACLTHRCATPQTWVADMAQMALYRHWRSSVDRLVGLSDAVVARLAEAGLAPDGVLRNAVAPRPARPALADEPVVAYAGRLAPEKGVDVLLHALAALGRRVRIVVAGGGPAASALQALAVRLDLDVEWHGHLSRPAMERLLDAAWVQVVPGRWEEPFGNVVTEGMVRGTAVLASAVGGPAEVLDDGRTGLLVPPSNVGALTGALDRLTTDRALVERLGAEARVVALARYGVDAVLDRVEALYAELLGEVA